MENRKQDYVLWESSREKNEREEREFAERQRLVGAVEGLASTKDGVHFLRWLLEETSFLGWVPVQTQEGMAYMEGRRSVGFRIFDLIKRAHCVEAVCQEDIDG